MPEDQGRANGVYSGGVVLRATGAIVDGDAAARFDGGNDKGSVPDIASLDFGVDGFTVEAWDKTASADERAVVAKRSVTASEPYWTVTVTDDSNHNGQIRAAFSDGLNVRQAYSSVAVLDNAWHHIAVWYDRDPGITIAVDGVAKTTLLAIGSDVRLRAPSRSARRRRTTTSRATSTRSRSTAGSCRQRE